MSLSSFLLKSGENAADKGKSIDKGLDDLFKTNTAVVAPKTSIAAPLEQTSQGVLASSKEKKRKHAEENETLVKPKKLKSSTKGGKHAEVVETPPKKESKKSKARAASSKLKSSEDSEDEDEPKASTSSLPASVPQNDENDESDSDDEGDPSKLVHESLTNGGKHKHGNTHNTKYVPEGETSEQRNARTVFVGNVPVDIMKTKSLQKQLKRHLLSFAPSAKIESVRFRSVAFSKSMTQLPPIDGSAPKQTRKHKDPRQHDKDRTASWRAKQGKDGDGDDEAGGAPEKTYLSTAEKKRIAFINQEFHEGVDAVNAYAVFAHPVPDAPRKDAVVMDPYEAAQLVAKEADGSVFMGRTIRTDLAAKGGAVNKADAKMLDDPKATVFVGNLDFASKEEDLRAFFEALMVEEKGKPTKADEPDSEGEDEDEDEQADGGDEDEESEDERDEDEGASDPKITGKGKNKSTLPAPSSSRSTWVKRVRIVRDKDTLLGKGFAYVQFADRECVDEILTLEPTRLKFAKRKLRVQRCKTLPGASKPVKAANQGREKDTGKNKGGSRDKGKDKSRSTPRTPTSSATPATMPKGDPRLGERLAGLSKDERKRAKAGDADRVARRLAKKRAKALADKGVKSRADKGKEDVLKVRKRPGVVNKGAAAKGSASKKGRVRSGKALAKMNAKK